MASDQEKSATTSASNSEAKRFAAEILVVAFVCLMMIALTASIAVYLKNAKDRSLTPAVAKKQIAPKPATAEPTNSISREEPKKDEPPDTSLAELESLEKQLKTAKQTKAKADLMAWVAEKSSAFLESRQKAAKSSNERLKQETAALAGQKIAVQEASARLADEIARLELEEQATENRYEAAKNFKGFSILPYRGPNGTWHRPLPIECANDGAQIMPGGPSFRLIDLELAGMSNASIFSKIIDLAMRKAAAQATPDGNAPTVYVLFVVRPSGIKVYYEARARLQAQGVAFGYELIDEKTPIEYPDLGDLAEWPGMEGHSSVASNAGGTGLKSNGVGNGGAINGSHSPVNAGQVGSGDGDGLFVWKNGLGGSRGPGGLNNETGVAAGEGRNEIEPHPRLHLGENAGGIGGEGRANISANNGRSSGGRSPQVDFGPGTLSQLRRGASGNATRNGMGNTTSNANGNEKNGRAETNPDLNPPWGNLPDGRRGTGLSGNSGRRESGGQTTGGAQAGGKPGTFTDLIAELNARGDDISTKLKGRPGAVAIMPGDLEGSDDLGEAAYGEPSSPNGIGQITTDRRKKNSGSMPGSLPPNINSRSPFGTSAPTLPRFEPVPGSETGKSDGNHSTEKSSAANQPATDGKPTAGATKPPLIASLLGSSSAGGSTENDSSRNGGGNSGTNTAEEKSERTLGSGLRRLFGGDNRLPEKAWEISIFCDADGLTIRPGEHRLKTADLQGDADLLPRTLQAMFEKQLREHPERYWRPYIRYRLASGGEPLMTTAQTQIAEGLIRWPALVEKVPPAGTAR